jgi:hypothetical protein
MIVDQYIPPPQEVVIFRPKHKDEDDGDANTILGADKDKHDLDNWLTARPEANTANAFTNKSGFGMPRGWDTKSSDDLLRRRNDNSFEAGQDTSRFGSPSRFGSLGLDGENVRDSERMGRDSDRRGRESYEEKTDSSLFRAFDRNSMDKEKEIYSAAGYSNFKDDSFKADVLGLSGSGAHQPKANESRPDSETGLPPGYDSYTPFDNSQSRLTSQLTGQQFGGDQLLRAWEQPPTANRSTFRNSGGIGAAQANPNRVVAPVRPINLPFPKRPGDY